MERFKDISTINKKEGSVRSRPVTTEEKTDFFDELICSQEEAPHTYLAHHKIAEQTRISHSSIRRMIKRKNFRRFKRVKTPEMNYGCHNIRYACAVALAEKFERNTRMIEKQKNSNFADYKKLYSTNKELEIVFRNLESDLSNVLAWFNINSLKENPGKFQFMVLGSKEADSFVFNIGKNKIENSTEVTLLGVKIDKQLKFKTHIEELCRKATDKLHALGRIR